MFGICTTTVRCRDRTMVRQPRMDGARVVEKTTVVTWRLVVAMP
jgi:hypothetical protein